jgi:hypothetical protein
MSAEHNRAHIHPDAKPGYLRLVPSHAFCRAYLIGISLFFIDLITSKVTSPFTLAMGGRLGRAAGAAQ